MEIKGKVRRVNELQEFESGFKKRDLILDITTKAEFPSYIKIEFRKDNTALLNHLEVGDIVSVNVVLSGSEYEYNGKINVTNNLIGLNLNT